MLNIITRPDVKIAMEYTMSMYLSLHEFRPPEVGLN